MTKEVGFCPYNIEVSRRLDMCSYRANLTWQELEHYNANDEARFDMNGEVNTQNVRR